MTDVRLQLFLTIVTDKHWIYNTFYNKQVGKSGKMPSIETFEKT